MRANTNIVVFVIIISIYDCAYQYGLAVFATGYAGVYI